jgi:hypothetical protein
LSVGCAHSKEGESLGGGLAEIGNQRLDKMNREHVGVDD